MTLKNGQLRNVLILFTGGRARRVATTVVCRLLQLVLLSSPSQTPLEHLQISPPHASPPPPSTRPQTIRAYIHRCLPLDSIPRQEERGVRLRRGRHLLRRGCGEWRWRGAEVCIRAHLTRTQDGLLGARILASLFKQDDVPYRLVPVGGYSELEAKRDEAFASEEVGRSPETSRCYLTNIHRTSAAHAHSSVSRIAAPALILLHPPQGMPPAHHRLASALELAEPIRAGHRRGSRRGRRRGRTDMGVGRWRRGIA